MLAHWRFACVFLWVTTNAQANVFKMKITGQYKYPFLDPSLSWDARVEDLVSRLTLEEIVEQSVARYAVTPPAISRLGIKPYQWINECLHGVRNHNATAFPQALGLGASFSRELIFNVSTTISTELRALYNADVKSSTPGLVGANCFSPVVNIMRHPLWGRNQETYGEDPYLTGQLSVQFIHGVQGDHPRIVRAAGGCKHFDAHSGPENIPTSRLSFDAKVSTRDWHMTYLPQFKTCLDAGSLNVMCSYNRINGIPACANEKLLGDILRKQWGFTGFVVSDANAIENIVTYHKYLSTLSEAAVQSVKAGCNLELTGHSGKDVSFYHLMDAINANNITEEEVRENAKKPFITRMRIGEFDPPNMNPYSAINMSVVLSESHREQATRAAEMSFVLLKNIKKTLPLRKRFDRMAIIGPMADNAQALFGDYPPTPDPKFISTPLEGLRSLGNETRYAAGCKDVHCTDDDYDPESIKKAVTGAQFVFVCLGTGADVEKEGQDRSELALPGNQLQILKDAEFFSREAPLVLLLFNAGPLDITWPKLSTEVDAIIACFFPAMTAGPALFRVITNAGPGSVPAARLPSTWPAQLHQVPPITDYNMTAGFTYRYMREGDPLYPFGFGLSYTSFHYPAVDVTPSSIKAGDDVRVTVRVLNRGPYDADEVTQVYMSWEDPTLPVPRWTLVGFERKHHLVDKESTLTFTVKAEQMAVWVDETTGMRVLPGQMTIYAGGQQPYQRNSVGTNVVQTSFTIA